MTISPVGKTPRVRPGTEYGVGRPCAAAIIFCAGLLSRNWRFVKLPVPFINKPALKEASLDESCEDAFWDELGLLA